MAGFTQSTEKHNLSKLIKIYGDFVNHIREVRPELLVDQVKGILAFLAFQKREAVASALKVKASQEPNSSDARLKVMMPRRHRTFNSF